MGRPGFEPGTDRIMSSDPSGALVRPAARKELGYGQLSCSVIASALPPAAAHRGSGAEQDSYRNGTYCATGSPDNGGHAPLFSILRLIRLTCLCHERRATP